jgi:hypothetical protein
MTEGLSVIVHGAVRILWIGGKAWKVQRRIGGALLVNEEKRYACAGFSGRVDAAGSDWTGRGRTGQDG